LYQVFWFIIILCMCICLTICIFNFCKVIYSYLLHIFFHIRKSLAFNYCQTQIISCLRVFKIYYINLNITLSRRFFIHIPYNTFQIFYFNVDWYDIFHCFIMFLYLPPSTRFSSVVTIRHFITYLIVLFIFVFIIIFYVINLNNPTQLLLLEVSNTVASPWRF